MLGEKKAQDKIINSESVIKTKTERCIGNKQTNLEEGCLGGLEAGGTSREDDIALSDGASLGGSHDLLIGTHKNQFFCGSSCACDYFDTLWHASSRRVAWDMRLMVL